MNTKYFVIGWICSIIVFCTLLFAIYNAKEDVNAKINCIENQLSQSQANKAVAEKDTTVTITEIFNDPSLEIVNAKVPTEFPAYNNPKWDTSISATTEEFADYFKKNFKSSNADQVIITATDINQGKKLRWHVRIHERK
jgi:hypothetical protein